MHRIINLVTHTVCDECGKDEVLLFGGWGRRLVPGDRKGVLLMQDICPACLPSRQPQTVLQSALPSAPASSLPLPESAMPPEPADAPSHV